MSRILRVMDANCVPLDTYLLNFTLPLNIFHEISRAVKIFRRSLKYDTSFFEGMANHVYPPKLQMNKINDSDAVAQFYNLHLSISYTFVASKI